MLTRHADSITGGETQRPPIEFMLHSLPTQHREIIVATYFCGRTTREAAQVLGLAPDTVKARLYYAMRDLSLMVATYRSDHADRPARRSLLEMARPGSPANHQAVDAGASRVEGGE